MSRYSLRAAAAFACVFGWIGKALAASPQPWEMGFQPAASPVKHALDDFHNLLLVIITGITLLVLGLLVTVVVRFNAKRNPVPSRVSHNTVLEVAWTVIPVIVLIVIAVPSFRLLYMMEVTPKAEMTIKVTGRQWYWDYEYPDHGGFTFSSIMVPDSELKPGQMRLLEVDNRMVVPVDTAIRLQVTGGDVIHSWALPAFGVKKDTVPGRLNETWFKVEKEGVYYGQCSELCGVNHAFMPIAVEVVSRDAFAAWVAKSKLAYGAPNETQELAQTPAGATDNKR